jgi:hypothetical protein
MTTLATVFSYMPPLNSFWGIFLYSIVAYVVSTVFSMIGAHFLADSG